MQRKKPTILNKDEQKKLLETLNTRYITNLRDKSMFVLMLDCGLRVSEAIDLKFRHIDELRNQLEIKDSKGAKDRIVTIPEPALNLLQKWIDRRAEAIEKGNYTKPDKRWVYITKSKGKGEPKVTQQHLDRKIKRCSEKAGIDKSISCHTLRHSFATDLYTKTRDIAKVQETLGHEDMQTARIYVHLSQAEVKEDVMGLRENRDVD